MEELNAGGRDHWTRWKGTVKWGEELGTFICRTENCPHSTENYHNPVPFLSSHYILTLPIITIKFPTEKSCGAKTTSKTQQYLTGMLRADLTFLHFSCFVTLVPLSELFIQWASLVKCFTVSPCPYELFILQTPPPQFYDHSFAFHPRAGILYHSGQTMSCQNKRCFNSASATYWMLPAR